MNDRPQPAQPLVLLCLAEASLALVAVLLAWLFSVPLGDRLLGEASLATAFTRGLLATIPLIVAFFLMLRSRWRPLLRLRWQVRRMVEAMFADASAVLLLLLAVSAGFGEELLFRGVLQPWLGQWLSPWGGVVMAGLLFGLAHPMSRLYVLLAAMGGIYLGALAYLAGEITSAMVAHALYDFVALMWFRWDSKPQSPTFS